MDKIKTSNFSLCLLPSKVLKQILLTPLPFWPPCTLASGTLPLLHLSCLPASLWSLLNLLFICLTLCPQTDVPIPPTLGLELVFLFTFSLGSLSQSSLFLSHAPCQICDPSSLTLMKLSESPLDTYCALGRILVTEAVIPVQWSRSLPSYTIRSIKASQPRTSNFKTGEQDEREVTGHSGGW